MSLSLFIMTGLEANQLWLRKHFPKIYGFINISNALFVGLARFMTGEFTAYGLKDCPRPEKYLTFYEFEGCPFCKVVREALCVLDIDYVVYPCPRTTLKSSGYMGDSKFRPALLEKGGKLMFPYMEDPNTGVSMYESADIVEYLWTNYGTNAKRTFGHRLAEFWPLKMFGLKAIFFARPCLDMGFSAIKSKTPEKLLELWGYEPSPFVKVVRECLCTLEIPYVMHTMPHGSTEKRKKFLEEHKNELTSFRKSLGMVQVPFLMDPNTGISMFESSDIVKYLKDTYQTGDYPSETWTDYGKGIDTAKKEES